MLICGSGTPVIEPLALLCRRMVDDEPAVTTPFPGQFTNETSTGAARSAGNSSKPTLVLAQLG
jgi:hypothetical protein